MVGHYGFGERKCLGDFDRKSAVGNAVEDVFARGAGEVGVGVDLAQCVTAHGEFLLQRDGQRKGRGLEGERSVFDENSVRCGGSGELIDEGTGDRIEDDARAFTGGDLVNASDEVLLGDGDDVIGTELMEFFSFL